MSIFRALVGAILSIFVGATGWAGDAGIVVSDAYARASSPIAKAGAAFLVLTNNSDMDDRLIGVESAAAKRVELHTHIMDDGVMMMRHDEDGFELPAGGSHALERGGDHVMMMGLTMPFTQGAVVPLTLYFEHADPITLDVLVDLTRD